MKNKALIALLTVVAVVLGISSTAFSGTAQASGGYHYDATVEGKADAVCGDFADEDGYTCDAERVQAAVDGGGRILLKGEFHFVQFDPATGYEIPGTDQYVDIQNDIEIHGEKEGKTYKTKVVGGRSTFRSGLDWINLFPIIGVDAEWFWPNDDDPHTIVIKNIHFDNSYFASVHLMKLNHAEITGCKFTDGRIWDGYSWAGLSVNAHLLLGTFNVFNTIPIELASAGAVVIDNEFDGLWRNVDPDDGDPWAVIGFDGKHHRGSMIGPLVWRMVGGLTVKGNSLDNLGNEHHHINLNYIYGPVRIIDNRVRSPYGAGGIIFQTRSWASEFDSPGSPYPEFGPVVIKDNFVEMPNDVVQHGGGIDVWNGGAYWGDTLTGVVIKDNSILNPAGLAGIYLSPQSGSIIENNKVTAGTYGLYGSSLADSVIKNNQFDVDGEAGIGLGSAVWLPAEYNFGSNRNQIADNKISGRASFGIMVGDFPGPCQPMGGDCPASTDNEIKDNNMKNLALVSGDYGAANMLFLPQTAGNTYKGKVDDVVWDFTSDYNPYDPDTYNGDNDIRLGQDH